MSDSNVPVETVKPLGMTTGRVISLAILLAVSACGTLPRSGPSGGDMMSAGNGRNDVVVINLDSTSVGLLQASQAPSLMGAFGDYRPAREQRIGVGDAIQITLWEAGPGGLFSSPVVDRDSAGSRSAVIPEQVVARDGSITVPFAGRISVRDRAPPEVERVIMQRLSDKAIDPQALVTVTRNISNTVTVIGEVAPGARVPLSVRGDRLLEVIATAGGVRGPISDIAVVLSRDDKMLRVPMEAVLDDPREDIFLQPGDIVTLVRDPQSFTAIGATARNGLIPFEAAGITLDEALAKVGGLADERADPGAVFVIRFENERIVRAMPQAREVLAQAGGVPTVYHLDMRDPAALFLARRFPIRNKDIVFVSNAPLSDVQKVFTLVNLLVTPAVTGLTVNNAVRP